MMSQWALSMVCAAVAVMVARACDGDPAGATTAAAGATTAAAAGPACDPGDAAFLGVTDNGGSVVPPGDLATGDATISCDFTTHVLSDGVTTPFFTSGKVTTCTNGVWGTGETWECKPSCGAFNMDCTTDPLAATMDTSYAKVCTMEGMAPAACMGLSFPVKAVTYTGGDFVMDGDDVATMVSCTDAEYDSLIFIPAANPTAISGPDTGTPLASNVCTAGAYAAGGFYMCAFADPMPATGKK